jgi:hypothetical protein
MSTYDPAITAHRDLGKDLLDRIIAYHAKPADVAYALLEPFLGGPDGPPQKLHQNTVDDVWPDGPPQKLHPNTVDDVVHLHRIQLIMDYLDDPESKRITHPNMRVPTSFTYSDNEKATLLESIKSETLRLRKILLESNNEQDIISARNSLRELGKRLVEVPFGGPGPWGSMMLGIYGSPLCLAQAVNDHMRDRGTIFNGSLGASLSKHLDIMERRGVPPEIVTRVLGWLILF